MTVSTIPHPHTLVFPAGVDLFEIPRRSYDFNKGDRRFSTQERAIEHAEAKALETSVRQIVRADSSPHFIDLWVVQAVGS